MSFYMVLLMVLTINNLFLVYILDTFYYKRKIERILEFQDKRFKELKKQRDVAENELKNVIVINKHLQDKINLYEKTLSDDKK